MFRLYSRLIRYEGGMRKLITISVAAVFASAIATQALASPSNLTGQTHSRQPFRPTQAVPDQILAWPEGVIPYAPRVKADLYAQRARQISASQAKNIAMDYVRGAKFVNVQRINPSTYRVRLQEKNGRIIDVYVDAYSGRVKN